MTTATITGLPTNERIWSFAGAKVGAVTRFFCITADVADIYMGVVGSHYFNYPKGIYSVDYGSGNWVSKYGYQFHQYISYVCWNGY